MEIKGAIFDLDGTLLDSMGAWDSVATKYLESKGIKASDTLENEIKSMSLEEACQYMKEQYNLEESPDVILKGILKIVESFYINRAELKEGVEAFLQALYKKGVKMCVATATDKAFAEVALTRNNVIDLFEMVITCSEYGCAKRTVDIYNIALGVLGTEKKGTVVFEDAYHAAKSAKDGGFVVCGVYDESENEPVEDICDFYIKSFTEAGEYFD